MTGELLVGREDELRALEQALGPGAGSAVLVEGPAGIGKTALLGAVRARAAEAGRTVLHARGTELERDFPLGVVRQCLEPAVRADPDLLRGAARHAEPAIRDVATVAAPSVGLLHGLHWLVANLAEAGPVALVVDDAHWADEPSLRFLAYLTRRIESLEVALVIGARDDQDDDPLSGVRDDPACAQLVLGPLSQAEVPALLGGDVDPAFARACLVATGGNPFLLDELARTLRADGVQFTAAAADRVPEVTPPALARMVRGTLTALSQDAAALARAAAVLGDGSALELAATLSGAGATAADELVAAGLLEDAREVRFRHPILINAVRDGLSLSERSAAHARAAALLRERGAASERVALQLLHTEPAGDAQVVAELRGAAERASRSGAPATALTLLRRALEEPPEGEERAEAMLEAGVAALLAGRQAVAAELLTEALDRAGDPLTRARAAWWLAPASPQTFRDRTAIVERVVADLGEVGRRDGELAWRLRAVLELSESAPPAPAATGATVGEAVYLGMRVFAGMQPRARAADVAALALAAASQVDGLLADGASTIAFSGVVLGLRWSDRLHDAERILDRAVATARRRGSAGEFASAMALRATVHRRAGRLRDAEADARAARDAAVDHGWLYVRGIGSLLTTLVAAGRLEEARAELVAAGADGELEDVPPMLNVLLARMGLRAAEREHAAALSDWVQARRRVEAGNGVNAGWIEDLAVVAELHLARGAAVEARAAADEAAELARHWDTPGARGQALLAQVRVDAVEDAVEACRAAAALLAESPVRLEHARALVTLGGLLRRAGHRTDSREPLREGYELAQACGAETVAESARAELRASGVRIAREQRTGAHALTPSERRIAGLAAGGLSNAEIAQDLFLTVKTVEMHLTRTYRKLDVRGRADLKAALGV